MTNPQAVEALRGNPADIYSRPWTRHGSGEDEWWSINGYTAKRDWRRTWVVRYRGVAVAEDNDLQQAMATALLKNSADGHAQSAPQPEAQPTERQRDTLVVNMMRFGNMTKRQARGIVAFSLDGVEPDPADFAPKTEAQALPPEWTPEMSRAVQLYSELGAYAAANLSGAYGLFEEFWNVAHRAAVSSPAPAPLSELQIADLFTARTGLDPEESRERFIWYRRGVRHVVEHLGGIGLDGGM